MEQLLRIIQSLMQEKPLDKKILLTQRPTEGRQILLEAARRGILILNTTVETMGTLAEKVSKASLYGRGMRPADPNTLQFLVGDILRQLKTSGDLTYFQDIEISPGITAALTQGITELRLAGFTADTLNLQAFVTPEKGRDLQHILKCYEERLKAQGLADSADVLSCAAALKAPEEGILILPDVLHLSTLEQNYLKAKPCVTILVETVPVFGLEHPYWKGLEDFADPRADRISQKKLQDIKSSAFSWLHTPEAMPPNAETISVQFLKAQGETCEVREVLRRMKDKALPLDQCCILYTTQEPYSQILYDLSLSLNLPVTFGGGISILNTRPGRLLHQLIQWIEFGYPVKLLSAMLSDGLLSLPEAFGIVSGRAAGMLEKSGIGWGRKRYASVLERLMEEANAAASIPVDENEDIFLPQKEPNSPDWQRLYALVHQLPDGLPAEDAPGHLWCAGLYTVLKRFTACKGPLDGEALKIILQYLEERSAYQGTVMKREEVLAELSHQLGLWRVGVSGPKPGMLHAGSYREGLWLQRSLTALTGLDVRRFPGSVQTDPILLDSERAVLSPNLPLAQHRGSENTYAMARLLASRTGTLLLCYSALDPVEMKEEFPAALLLQALRCIRRDPDLSYDHLYESFPGHCAYIPKDRSNVLSESEWWLAAYASGYVPDRGALEHRYPHLMQGRQGFMARASAAFTPFDGYLAECMNALKARLESTVFSASRLERFAKCPQEYFFKYLLRLEPPEETECDPNVWLDPLQKGRLLHTLFERFMGGLAAIGETPSSNRHGEAQKALAEALIEQTRAIIPPPSESVFSYEVQELLTCCRIFLAMEAAWDGAQPIYFELGFGNGKVNPAPLAELPPVALSLPSGRRIQLRGSIDRVDRLSDGTYRVLDYKTGKSKYYSGKAYVDGGRQLQHVLYALALEHILTAQGLEPKPIVSEYGYLFPTLRGEGERCIHTTEQRSAPLSLLEDMFGAMEAGLFPVAEDGKLCPYCDYLEVCGRMAYEPFIPSKHRDEQVPALMQIRRLKTYE